MDFGFSRGLYLTNGGWIMGAQVEEGTEFSLAMGSSSEYETRKW